MKVIIKQILEKSPRMSKAQKPYNLVDFMGEDGKLYKEVYESSFKPFAEGQEIEGEWKTDQFGTKFEITKTTSGGGFGKSPEQQAAIVRQHSQEMSLMYCTLKGKTDVTFKELQTVIDWFEMDAKGQRPTEKKSEVVTANDEPPMPEEKEMDINEVPDWN